MSTQSHDLRDPSRSFANGQEPASTRRRARTREREDTKGQHDTKRAQPQKVRKLIDAAREAGEIRSYQTDPDVVALQVERIRAWSTRLVWAGIVIGLGFTMVNVQQFAAQGAPRWSPEWITAWLLDPMVSLILIGVLLAEQVTARYQVAIGSWPRVAKWAALAATYTMNTWSAWAAKDVPLIVLHSVPPLMVFTAVEAVPAVRDRLTEAVLVAERHARERGTPKSAVATEDRPTAVPSPSRDTEAADSPPAVPSSRPAVPTPTDTAADNSGDSIGDKSADTALGDTTPVRTAPADNTPRTAATDTTATDSGDTDTSPAEDSYADKLTAARALAAQLHTEGHRITRKALRDGTPENPGITGSNGDLNTLAGQLRDELEENNLSQVV